MNSTTIIIQKESTFKLPQGHYPAQVTQFKVKEVSSAKGKSQSATILFEVWVPGMENYECIARKVVPLDLKAGSVMRRFLEGLLGDSYFKTKSNQAIDLQSVLVGKTCWVELIHTKHDADRFDFPLVDVESIELREPETEGKD
jgi:hypothetical protein